MRYPAAEKLEIIRIVETSPLPVRRTLAQIGIPKSTFYTWLDRYVSGGLEALEDRRPRPRRVWNRIADQVRDKVIALALDQSELSPREVAVTFTDRHKTFVSEASVYRLLKAEGLITSPAFILMQAADRFANPTTAINQLWQTDFTYLKVTGWGWFYLSTVLDDFSRYIIAWKLCTTMAAADVTDTLAAGAAGLRARSVRLQSEAAPAQRQRPVLCRQRSVRMARRPGHAAHARKALSPDDPGQDRTMASLIEEPNPARELLSARRSRTCRRRLRRPLQSSPLPREPRQSHASRRLLRTRTAHSGHEKGDQTTHHRSTSTHSTSKP